MTPSAPVDRYLDELAQQRRQSPHTVSSGRPTFGSTVARPLVWPHDRRTFSVVSHIRRQPVGQALCGAWHVPALGAHVAPQGVKGLAAQPGCGR